MGTVSSGYDADGHRTSLTYPDGYVVTYAYDATGAPSSVSDSTAGLIASYTYDNLGRLTALTRNGGPGTSLGYSTADLTLSALSHGFSDTSKNVSFGYANSPAGQLITSTSSNTLYNYTAPTSVTINSTVDGQNKLTAVGGVGVASDARGNLTSDGTTGISYGYDVANELTSTSAGATLSYDALGRLSSTVNASKATTKFLYDGSQILEEFANTGGENQRFVLGAGVDQPLVWFKGTGEPTTAANRLWFLPNHQGSIIAIANATTTTAINTYDEAGNQGPSDTGRFLFQGMPYIGITGLYHDRAREYDANIGRFMQSDPIGYGDGMNWYNYVHGDPVNGWDPSGLDDCPVGYQHPPGIDPATNKPFTKCEPIPSSTVSQVVVTAINAILGSPLLSAVTGQGNITLGSGALGGGASPQKNTPSVICKAVAKLPAGYGVYYGAQATAVPGAGFSDSVKTTYVSNGNGGATYSTVESAYIGGGFSLFGGGTAGVVVPNFNSASASVPFGLGGFLPKGFSAALGLGGDIGPNNIGLSLGVGYAAGLLGNGNKNNSASRTLSSGGC